MNSVNQFPVSPVTVIKTPWEKSAWGKMQRYLLSVNHTGRYTIKEVSKGVFSFIGNQVCCLSPLPVFSPKTCRVIDTTEEPYEKILGRLSEEQRNHLINWRNQAIVNQFPMMHILLDNISRELDRMIPELPPNDYKRQCLEVLNEEIHEQKAEHLDSLKKATSSLALQQAGFLFLERTNLLNELFDLYRSES